MLGANISITAAELALIRRLTAFELTMLLSEINDHGWTVARTTLAIIGAHPEYRKQTTHGEEWR
jgi:hypothetical protein